MNWIEEIKKLRAPGQSDAGLAADLGVSKQFLSDVLAGKKELSLTKKERDGVSVYRIVAHSEGAAQ